MGEDRPHQYLSDIDGLAGEPDSSWINDDGHDGGTPLGLHDTNLFDQDESTLGADLIDPATGEQIDNSSSRAMREFSVYDIYDNGGVEDVEYYVYEQRLLMSARARQAKAKRAKQ